MDVQLSTEIWFVVCLTVAVRTSNPMHMCVHRLAMAQELWEKAFPALLKSISIENSDVSVEVDQTPLLNKIASCSRTFLYNL